MDELLAAHLHYCEQVRHHQDERRAIANTLVVAIAALIAVAAVDQKLDANDRLLAIALFVIGIFGSLCMIKCHGLIRFYKEAAKQVAVNFTNVDLAKIEKSALNGQPRFWKVIDSIRLWYLWLSLFLLVALGGGYLAH